MPAKRIDFKYVRDHADFIAVLAAYGVAAIKDGTRQGQYKCQCPFHDDRRPSMKVNTQRNIFNCFVCEDGHGNVLDFVMKMDGVDIRSAAKTVARLSGIDGQAAAPSVDRTERQTERRDHAGAVEKPSPPMPNEPATDGVSHNRVLSFELKNLDTTHPFLNERGLTPEMVAEFGLGIATRGIMKDRLVFPIHNADGGLVAYCGRFVGDDPPGDEPKYKLPPHFLKELELFNWHRAAQRLREKPGLPLVIVESYFSAVKLHHWGHAVVSPMGRSLSAQQLARIVDAGVGHVTLLLDGDDPGRLAVTTMGRQFLAAGVAVSAPVVPEDFKPHRNNNDSFILHTKHSRL